MGKYTMISELIRNGDFDTIEEFETSEKEQRDDVLDFLEWRAGGGHFLNEETSSKYVEACRKLFNIIK